MEISPGPRRLLYKVAAQKCSRSHGISHPVMSSLRQSHLVAFSTTFVFYGKKKFCQNWAVSSSKLTFKTNANRIEATEHKLTSTHCGPIFNWCAEAPWKFNILSCPRSFAVWENICFKNIKLIHCFFLLNTRSSLKCTFCVTMNTKTIIVVVAEFAIKRFPCLN